MEEVLETSDSEELEDVEEQLSTDRRGFMTGRWGAKPTSEYDRGYSKPRTVFLSALMTFGVFAGTVAFSGSASQTEDNVQINFQNYQGLNIDKATLTRGDYEEESTKIWGMAEYEIPSEGVYNIEVSDNQRIYRGSVYLKPGEEFTVDLEEL